LGIENKRLVELLRDEKNHMQQELEKYKEMQKNLEGKASKLAFDDLNVGD